jgi:ABC-2 type transport system ATP-binding protein
LPEIVIEARGLVKEFDRSEEKGESFLEVVRNKVNPRKRRIVAVDKVSLDITRGEMFGLLGPNGAGKTTLIKLLCTLLLPTSGSARVAGHDVVREAELVRRKVGVVLGGERALYWRLTARENLWFFSQLYDIPEKEAKRRIRELLELVGLAERADDRVENYSKGMKQRLHIARGLINEPEIILLDEPTIGLDPAAGRELRALVRDLTTKQGRTVVLTTHYMQEADEMSHRVGVINKGRIIALDSPERLKRSMRSNVVRASVRNADETVKESLKSIEGVEEVVSVGFDAAREATDFKLISRDPEKVAPRVFEAVNGRGAHVLSLAIETPTLEDVFISLTGEVIDGAPKGPEGHGGHGGARGGHGGGGGLG